jgi:hypothetical protein
MLLFYKPKYIIAKTPTVPTKTGLLAKAKCGKTFLWYQIDYRLQTILCNE